MAERIKLLTILEFANELSMSPKTVWAWKAARKVTVVKVGRNVRIPATEVERIIAAGTIPARQAW